MRYSFFANLLVHHDYYKGECLSFYFVPSKSTSEELKRNNMIVVDSHGRLKILGGEDSFGGVGDLYFAACTDDFDLWNVTIFHRSNPGEVPVFVVKNGDVSRQNESVDEIRKVLDVPKLMFVVKLCSPCLKKMEKSVEIPLETRKCKWQYCIKNDSSLFDLKIHSVDEKDAVLFDERKSSNGETVFTSRTDLPIVYGDSPKFQLQTKDTSRILMKTLPNMNSKSLSRIELNGGGYEIVAESFINL